MASTFGSPYPDHYVRLPNAFYDGDQISIEALGSATTKQAIAPRKSPSRGPFTNNGADSIKLLVDEARRAHLELFQSQESPLNDSQLTSKEMHATWPKPRSRPLATSAKARKNSLADGRRGKNDFCVAV